MQSPHLLSLSLLCPFSFPLLYRLSSLIFLSCLLIKKVHFCLVLLCFLLSIFCSVLDLFDFCDCVSSFKWSNKWTLKTQNTHLLSFSSLVYPLLSFVFYPLVSSLLSCISFLVVSPLLSSPDTRLSGRCSREIV